MGDLRHKGFESPSGFSGLIPNLESDWQTTLPYPACFLPLVKRSINKEGEETLSVSNDVDKSVYVCTRWFPGEITQIHAKKKKKRCFVCI